jgi:imidazole glycerol-phosphate synthase subunit HisF
MVRPRIIPCLLIQDKALVKTVQFKSPKYIGDPINTVRIFNEKQVDELMILDIDATINNRPPDFAMIAMLAAECRMPLCYGGGIKTADEAERIINLGVEKLAVSTAAISNPMLISAIAKRTGTQSVVVVLDIKKKLFGNYEVYFNKGRQASGMLPVTAAKMFENHGTGEIVINSIDRDGMMKGYDLELVHLVKNAVGVPVTVLGGAGTLNDMAVLIREYPVIGAAAGSLFVYKGVHKAVLINYPSVKERRLLDA